MNFAPEFLDEIRSRIRVSEIVGKRIKLLKRGNEFLAVCPFHNDTKPSLSIVDDKNFYHCFACGAHGDIIKFTSKGRLVQLLKLLITGGPIVMLGTK